MKMTITKKLYIGIGLSAIVFVALIMYAYLSNKRVDALLQEADMFHETQNDIALRIVDHFVWAAALSIDTIMSGKEFTGKLDPTKCKLGLWLAEFKPSPEIEDTFGKVKAPHEKIHATAEKIIAALKEGDQDRAKKLFITETRPALTEIEGLLLTLQKEFKSLVDDKAVEVERQKKHLYYITIAAYLILLLAFIAGSILAFVKPHRSGFQAITKWSQSMAQGDMTKNVEINSDDEFSGLAKTLNVLTSILKDVIFNVADGVYGLNSQVAYVAASFEEQAAISAEQSASVVEITATMEELSSSSTQIAEQSKIVVVNAERTWGNSRNGAAAVDTVIMKMKEIHADNQNSIGGILELGRKSKEITKVMEIINNIADQTKLIAFNAALEASSAGEAGKRFGVVAVEIRRLADSVMASTGEIEEKISEVQESISRLVISSEESTKGIQKGMEHTNQAAAILLDIIDAAQSTEQAAKQISLATQQQKTASSQVVTALREMAEGAVQISASIRQISSVSGEFKMLSDHLMGQIEKFKID